MKKLLFFLLLAPLLGFVPHKFYVTNNIVEYNARTKLYEVTCKIFTDDLERAISPDGKSMFLGSENENIDADAFIEKYVSDHFKITLNGQKMTFKYIGKEVEPDLTHVYFEFSYVDLPTSVTVENNCFFDIFEGHKNIIDLRLNGWYKTVILTAEHPIESNNR
ncbi:MAG: DUF6702 family protein [Flavobacteriales bacterium]